MWVVISSFDSDFFQLINNNVSVLRCRGTKTTICDKAYIQSKFGFLPEKYVDFKSLVGDGSDNIKGVEKVGVKIATALINQFGNLQNVISGVDGIGKQSIRESVKRSIKQLKMNYDLIKLKSNSTLRFEINDLGYTSGEFTTIEILRKIGTY